MSNGNARAPNLHTVMRVKRVMRGDEGDEGDEGTRPRGSGDDRCVRDETEHTCDTHTHTHTHTRTPYISVSMDMRAITLPYCNRIYPLFTFPRECNIL